MPGPLLQLVSELSGFPRDMARSLGAVTLSFAPHPEPGAEPGWDGLDVYAPRPGEGALAAWQRTLNAVTPAAVWVHGLDGASPGLLLDLRERGIPYAVFLNDFAPLCPTRRLWHRRQERCSGPGRTGWKCAWCTGAPGAGGWAGLPLRWLAFRQRPQAWRTALLRAEALLVPSRFAREFWIAQGAPPERIAVIAPVTEAALSTAALSTALAGSTRAPTLSFAGGWDEAAGSELLGAALDLIRTPLHVLARPGHGRPESELDAEAAARLRAALAPRHTLDFETPAAASAVAVVPARWEIPYSRDVFTAQAAGQPVVATALGGLAEQIIHGVNGYLAAPGDPAALAESIQEALAEDGPAWDPALVARQARAEAAGATAQLRRLLKYLTEGAAEVALQLEHRDWLVQQSNGRSLQENTETLIAALRLAGIDAAPAAGEEAFARRAEDFTRRRRLELNHAIAFFRACGCLRVSHLPAPPAPDDERDRFQAWGIELVPAESLPCGLMQDQRTGEELDPGWLRRHFPQARAGVALTPSGVETAVWD